MLSDARALQKVFELCFWFFSPTVLQQYLFLFYLFWLCAALTSFQQLTSPFARSLACRCRTHARLSTADKAFTAMQFIAVILCSIAMVVLMPTLFWPAGGGCFGVKTAAMIGASLMIGFALCQMLAILLVIIIVETGTDIEGCIQRC